MTQQQVGLPDMRTSSGNLLLLSVPSDRTKLLVLECLIPFSREDSVFDSFNFKFPMFLVAMGVVFFYQFWNRGKKEEAGGSTNSKLIQEFERGGKRMSDKGRKDLMEIEGMIGSLGDLGGGMGKMGRR